MKTKSLSLIICAIFTLFFTETFSQVGVNNDGTSPDASSMLDVKSTTKGMLVPRMSAAERDLISSPANGLMIFCTDDNFFYLNRGTSITPAWTPVNPITSGIGTLDYLTRWTSSNSLGTGIIRDNNSNVGINSAPDVAYRLKVDAAGTNMAVYGRFNDYHEGLLGTASFGVVGYNSGSSIGQAGVYGYNSSESAGTPGIIGANGTYTYGTSYSMNNSANGVVGYSYNGLPYHFGVYGSRYDQVGGPSAGVIGTVDNSDGNKPWGALGFQDSPGNEFAGYFNGNINITGGIKDGSGYGVAGSVLSSNGSNDVYWSATSVISGSGTLDYQARWTSSSSLGTGITRDNNSTVGINTAPDGSYRLKVDGAGTNTAVYGHYDDNHYGSLGTSSYGVAGYNLGTTAGNSGVYGYNNSTNLGTPGVYGYNNTSLGGGLYDLDNTVNGVVGFVSKGYAYHFGVFGSRSDDAFGPSAGVIGSVSYNNQAKPWGALGFQDAVQEEYAGYFNGNINITGGLKDGSGFGVPGSVLLSNGASDVYWSTTAGISGTGSTNYIPKWSNSTTLTNSGIYESGSSVCIGTLTPSAKLTVNSGATSTSVYGQYNASILGYLGSVSYGAYGQVSATQYGYLGGASYGVYGQNGGSAGYLGGSLYGTYGQFSGSQYGYLGGSSYGAYGQNATNNGHLGGPNYGAYGQSSSNLYGYLGGLSYGSYGQYNSTLYGYMGGSGYGVYGQNGASIAGYLGGSIYGAYGQNSSTRFGYMGGSSYGTYGQYSGTLYGYLGGSLYGAYGQNSATLYGYLGGSYGAYGQYSATQFGYLGGLSYGVWGQYSSTRYGNLGSVNYGAYGQYSNDIYGELGTISYGVQGYHATTGGAAGYFNHQGAPATTNTSQWSVDGYMYNTVANDGSTYAYSSTTNNSGSIRGYNHNGALYTFAVAGWNYNDDNRCAGVFGANNTAAYWGALGYKDSGNSTYGGYFTSSGSGSGKSTGSGSAEGIGVGAWGDLMGADVHGGVYGLYVEGNNFGIYSKGTVFSDQPAVQLQDVGKSERAVLYSGSSPEVTVTTAGQGSLMNGHCSIIYNENFKDVISRQVPVIITVTPMGPSNGVYISSSDDNGFSIAENNDGNSNVTFSYIAIGRRAGYEDPQVPNEVIASDFESNITEGLHNDADMATDGKGLYYQNGSLRAGQSASMMQKPK